MMTYTTFQEKPYRPRRRLKRSWRIALTVLCAALALSAVYVAVLVRRQLGSNQNPADLSSTPGYGVAVPDWVEEDLLPLNAYSRPGEALPEISGVVIHYVGNPGTSAQANRNYFAGLARTGETSASSHFIVGLEGEILQCVPLSEISYCSNTRNYDTIAIEVCHADDTGQFSPDTLASVERLTAWLCVQFDLDTDQVIRHYDVSGKICPKYYVEHQEAWTDLLAGVEKDIRGFTDETA